MKRVLAILFFVPFVMALAPPCHAAGNGEIAVSLVDVPAELQERSVLITLGNGPNDTDAVLVMLNGLNQYSQTVTLPEGTYYCNAAVQYDALNDWPLREVEGTTFLQVEAGGQYELQYEFAGESWEKQILGFLPSHTPVLGTDYCRFPPPASHILSAAPANQQGRQPPECRRSQCPRLVHHPQKHSRIGSSPVPPPCARSHRHQPATAFS